jgi:hypothetical protein
MDLLHNLVRYGLDYLYPKLEWNDKIQILDIANRSEANYVQKAFNRVIYDLMSTPYEEMIQDIGLTNLVTIIAHLSNYKGLYPLRVELWSKLQLCTI